MSGEPIQAPVDEQGHAPQAPLIFIIEDVQMIHEVIQRTLRDLNPQLLMAQDGLTALEMMETVVPDLVILDLALPVLDGWEVLRRLRADPRTASIPILIITAQGQSGLEEKVKTLGANAYLDKPFPPKNLRTAVYELLGLS